MDKIAKKLQMNIPDRQLACAPIDSDEGQNYLKAMAAGANYAWANRQMIQHWVRESFENVLKQDAESLGLNLLYDVAHNIIKKEKHQVGKVEKTVYVHRKGATRAFGPGREEIPEEYRSVGQPVIIPGTMGTASYVLSLCAATANPFACFSVSYIKISTSLFTASNSNPYFLQKS